MRKFILIAAAGLVAGAAVAEVKQQQVSSTLVTTAASTNTVPVRGKLHNIYFDIPANKTAGVSVVSSEGFTLLSVSGVTADTLYLPRAAVVGTSGASFGTNIVDGIAVVGDVTVTITPAANTTGTNSYSVKINYAD